MVQRFPEKDWPDVPFTPGIELVSDMHRGQALQIINRLFTAVNITYSYYLVRNFIHAFAYGCSFANQVVGS